jgi:hypothetical protein
MRRIQYFRGFIPILIGIPRSPESFRDENERKYCTRRIYPGIHEYLSHPRKSSAEFFQKPGHIRTKISKRRKSFLILENISGFQADPQIPV